MKEKALKYGEILVWLVLENAIGVLIVYLTDIGYEYLAIINPLLVMIGKYANQKRKLIQSNVK